MTLFKIKNTKINYLFAIICFQLFQRCELGQNFQIMSDVFVESVEYIHIVLSSYSMLTLWTGSELVFFGVESKLELINWSINWGINEV